VYNEDYAHPDMANLPGNIPIKCMSFTINNRSYPIYRLKKANNDYIKNLFTNYGIILDNQMLIETQFKSLEAEHEILKDKYKQLENEANVLRRNNPVVNSNEFTFENDTYDNINVSTLPLWIDIQTVPHGVNTSTKMHNGVGYLVFTKNNANRVPDYGVNTHSIDNFNFGQSQSQNPFGFYSRSQLNNTGYNFGSTQFQINNNNSNDKNSKQNKKPNHKII